MTESEKNENKLNQEERIKKAVAKWHTFYMLVIVVMFILGVTLAIQNENSALMQFHYKLQSAIHESNDTSTD